ncbi:MAG: GTP-binding protein, partial [Planctomycetota bacterium]|nr:GTP-binding protein [Planctomycetota bacterium]
EDVVEIHTFGAKVLLQGIVEYFITKGARLAEPGEFTKRAFLNGRINLSQASAVLNIIHSSSVKEHQLALNQLYQHSTTVLKKVNAELTNLISRIELSLDFSDQEIELITANEIEEVIRRLSNDIRTIIENTAQHCLASDGIICVLCGRPNVGKSSIFNRLIKDRKNIVSPIPGTTRDYIEGGFVYRNIKFRLFDTAGIIHQTREAKDKVFSPAPKSIRNLLSADVYLMVIDCSEGMCREDKDIFNRLDHSKTIVVINKVDIRQKGRLDIPVEKIGHRIDSLCSLQVIYTSALTGKGITDIKKALVTLTTIKPPNRMTDDTTVSLRQKEMLNTALRLLNNALKGVKENLSYEFIALDLRQALETLNSALGIHTAGKTVFSDNILNNI